MLKLKLYNKIVSSITIHNNIKIGIQGLTQNVTKDKNINSMLCRNLELLYRYFQMIDKADEDLKSIFAEFKLGISIPEKYFEDDIKKLLQNEALLDFLDLDINHIKNRYQLVQNVIKNEKEFGNITPNKIIYQTLGGIWAILEAIGLSVAKQKNFIYKFCIIAEIQEFGKRHRVQDYVSSKDKNYYRRQDKQVIKHWYNKSKIFMHLPYNWGAKSPEK